MPPTEIRMSVVVATLQLQPVGLTEADLRAPAEEIARLTRANERAELGKLYIHKAEMHEDKKGGESSIGLMQSAMFDIDNGSGRDELRELLDAVKTSILERMYPPYDVNKLIQ